MKAEKIEQENAKLKIEAYSSLGNRQLSAAEPPQHQAKAFPKASKATSAVVLTSKDTSASRGIVIA